MEEAFDVCGDAVDNEPRPSSLDTAADMDNDLEDQWEADEEEDDEGGLIDEPELDADNMEPQATGDDEALHSESNSTTSANTAPPILSHTPPYIERVSVGHPSAPLKGKTIKHGYQLYQDDLHARADAGNPWAPFNSKIDWEIAHWAKLRGPGSTAVSELLNIGGVSISSQVSYKY